MNDRIHAGRVIASRKLLEAVVTSGYYLALTVGLLLGLYLVSAFADSIGSSGFSPRLHPVYDHIVRILEAGFGRTFVARVFAEGPFFFALHIAFAPILLYLALSSVSRFGSERNAGAIELLSYGPADGTAYVAGSFCRDIVLAGAALIVLTLFFGLSAALNNLVLGPMFVYALFSLCLLSAVTFAYAALVSVTAESASSGIALFLGVVILMTVVQAASFMIVAGDVRDLAAFFSLAISWISPFYYWQVGLDAVEADRTVIYLLTLLAMAGLSVGLLAASHYVSRYRGVRS